MAKADGTVNYSALDAQDGTLATLSSTLDLATYSAAWNGTSLPTATLANQLAILALTLKNSTGSSDLTSTITGVTVSDGTYSYAVTRSAAAGPIYVAILPTTSANIDVTATDGTTNYTKSLTGKTYAAGNGYSVSWKMAEVYKLLSAASAEDIGKVVCAAGHLHDAKTAVPAGCTAVGILGKVTETGCGLILALKDATHQRLDVHDRLRRNHAEAAARRCRTRRQPDKLHHAGRDHRVRLGRGAEERLRGDIHQPRLDD